MEILQRFQCQIVISDNVYSLCAKTLRRPETEAWRIPGQWECVIARDAGLVVLKPGSVVLREERRRGRLGAEDCTSREELFRMVAGT